MMKRIILMGFMGAGKTTVGKVVANALACDFIDTDECIEREQGRRISEIFAEDGETAFRDMETELLRRLLTSEKSFILSVGGGMPEREENRKLLRSIGKVIYLKTSKEEIVRRVSGDKNRPLLQGGDLADRVSSLMSTREALYIETAHECISTDGKNVSELAEQIKLMEF